MLDPRHMACSSEPIRYLQTFACGLSQVPTFPKPKIILFFLFFKEHMHQWYFYVHVFFHNTHTVHYVLLFFHYKTSDYQLYPHFERTSSLKLSIISNTYHHFISCRNDGIQGISILKILVDVFLSMCVRLLCMYVIDISNHVCGCKCEGATKL